MTRKTFKKRDYYSGDGFMTTIWGPAQWHFLHTISFNYPVNPTDEQKTQYMNYVLSLKHILPCGACRKNLTHNLEKFPITIKHMESRDSFSKYIYHLHELVNKMLKKKSGLTYYEVRERYEHFRARCTVDKETTTVKEVKKEKQGCTEPLYGKKARCIINIVPQNNKQKQSIKIDKSCIKRKLHSKTRKII